MFFKKRTNKGVAYSASVDLTPLEIFASSLLEKASLYVGQNQINYLVNSVSPSVNPSNLPQFRIIHNALTPEQLKGIVEIITVKLKRDLGREIAEQELDEAMKSVTSLSLSESDLSNVIHAIPSGFLEEEKVKHLSRAELEKKVLEKTAELRKTNEILEKKVEERTAELQKLLAQQHESAKILVRRDIELTKANEKLEELDEVKSNFISVVAHQLRTPLSGIKWTLSMLLNGDMGALNNDQKTFLMKGYESNARMITLVNDMLVTDRIQSGKIHFGFKYVDIIDLMDNVLFEISPQASKRNISIEYKSKFENLPQAYIDPESIRGVLQNLLENAIKYTTDNGRIEVDVKQEPDHLVISITDNGIGIPKDQVKDVFVKFFRARNATKQETDGSGLGLYIAKTNVEKNGGKIWFDSTEGKGSTFYFTVPLQENY